MTSGLRFPLRLSALGRVEVLRGDDKLKQNLRMIASTSLRSRWYEPQFGSTGSDLLFATLTPEAATQAERLLQEAFAKHEPRVQTSTRVTQRADGVVLIEVSYLVLSTLSQGSFDLEVRNGN